MTFDKSLSQHAFALAVDNSGKKAAAVVMDAVRNEFGANAVIAPSAVAANGERVESVKRMSPVAKVKQQIAMAKAGLAASSLGASLGIHMGERDESSEADCNRPSRGRRRQPSSRTIQCIHGSEELE